MKPVGPGSGCYCCGTLDRRILIRHPLSTVHNPGRLILCANCTTIVSKHDVTVDKLRAEKTGATHPMRSFSSDLFDAIQKFDADPSQANAENMEEHMTGTLHEMGQLPTLYGEAHRRLMTLDSPKSRNRARSRLSSDRFDHSVVRPTQPDELGEYLRLRCKLGEKERVTRKHLRHNYEAFCQENGAKPLDAKSFALRLRDRGISDCRVRAGGVPCEGWKGVSLAATSVQQDTELQSSAFSATAAKTETVAPSDTTAPF